MRFAFSVPLIETKSKKDDEEQVEKRILVNVFN